MELEWDEGKNAANVRKHGSDFYDGARVFFGPTLEYPDDRHDYGEQRIVAYGEVEGRILAIVYTWREDRRRIISARRATRYEAEAYYKALYP